MAETTNTPKADNGEQHTFSAEINQLLNILVYSLYTEREIFLRELISNAADALDKIRYISLTDKDVLSSDENLQVNIEVDKENKIIRVIDNGIGMTHDELIQNVGTIAKSGSNEFINALKENAQDNKSDKNAAIKLIGQFGVGFYSVFMVAKQVNIYTKSYIKDQPANKWTSDGSGTYSIEKYDKSDRGTIIEVLLKDDADEFTEDWKIKDIINRYSHFVSYPIVIDEKRINEQLSIWTRSKNEITDDEYKEFYKYISHDTEEPLSWIHINVEGAYQYTCLLYFPKNNFEFMGLMKQTHGVGLYVNRVLIDSQNKDLLPEYLRFMRGVVDSEDIPLNVSRQALQDNRIVRAMKNNIVKKILGHLEELAKDSPDKYLTFWKQFGKIIKEGFSQDFENRETLSNLLRFNSSQMADQESLTSLKDYVSRMKEGQDEIYFVTGQDRASIENNPHIELFQKMDTEVIYLYEPMDEFVLTGLLEYEGKKFKSIDAPDISILNDKKDEDETKEEGDEEKDKKAEELSPIKPILERCREVLGTKVKDVKVSKRLKNSPSCLVNPESGMSMQVQKIMNVIDNNYQITPKIMELNPDHQFIKALNEFVVQSKNKEFVDLACQQLYENAMLAEGLMPDIKEMVPRIQKMMEITSQAFEKD